MENLITGTGTKSKNNLKMKENISRIIQKLYMPVLLILLILISSTLSKSFLTVSNMLSIIRFSSLLIISSIGMLMVIIVRGFDLSIDGVIVLSSVLLGFFLEKAGLGLFSVPIVLAFGILVGFVNGILTAYAKIEPLIVTLGMSVAVTGLGYQVNNVLIGGSLQLRDKTFLSVFGARSGFFQSPMISMIIVAIIFSIVLNYLVFGRRLRIIGGNPDVATLSGINTKQYIMFSYMVCSCLAALTGILSTAMIGSSTPRIGTGYALQSLTVVFLGGATFAGGKGSVVSTVIAGLILGVISNMLNLLNLPVYPQQMINGLILVLAVGLRKAWGNKH